MFSSVRRYSGRSSVLSVEEANPEKTKKNKLSSVGVLTAAINKPELQNVTGLGFGWFSGGVHGEEFFLLISPQQKYAINTFLRYLN